MGQKQLHCGYFGVAKRRDPPQLMTIYFDEVVLYFDEGICKDCPKSFTKLTLDKVFERKKIETRRSILGSDGCDS